MARRRGGSLDARSPSGGERRGNGGRSLGRRNGRKSGLGALSCVRKRWSRTLSPPSWGERVRLRPLSLTRIGGAPKPRQIAVYDLEWVPETYELRMAGYYDGERYTAFSSVRRLLNHLLTPARKNTFFYAHAGGLADMHFLLQAMQEVEDMHVTAAFSGSSAIVVQVLWRGDKYTFLDSYWLLRDKLAHLAPFTGIDKARDSYKCADYPACGHVGKACASAKPPGEGGCGCHVGPEPLCMFRAPLPILRDYNERDCRILYRAIELFQEELLELGSELASTIASTALTLFRTKYLSQTIPTNPGRNDILRASYVASRVEVLRPVLRTLPGAPARYYDINSSFPYAMTFPAPGEFLGESKRIPDDDSIYFADCDVVVPDMFLPPLGSRGKDGRVYFPTGSWRGLFARADLELLLEAGGSIAKAHNVMSFAPFQDLAAYALDLYDLRAKAKADGQSFRALLLKYLLNACYGKFGEHRDKEQLVMHPFSESCPHAGAHDVYRDGYMSATCVESLFPGCILVSEERNVAHEHVPIASHITATARATLYRFLARCGEDVYYTDTDSIVTGQTLPTGPELGALKLEHEVVSGRFIQPKLYELDGEIRSKGFSRLTPEEFEELVAGREVEVERMYRVKETARELKTFGAAGKTFGKRIRVGASRPKRQTSGENATRPWTAQEIQEKWRVP